MKQITLAKTNQIVEFLAPLRIATRAQILELFGDEASTKEALRTAKSRRYITEKTIHIPAAGGEVDMLYLIAKGKDLIKKVNPGLTRFVRTGLPDGYLANRIYHELLVVEVFCWFAKRAEVIGFVTEDQLKARGETSADLRVVTIEDDRHIVFDCEVVVSNTRAQIHAKSAHLIYFTPTLNKADMIETERGAVVNLIKLKTNFSAKPIAREPPTDVFSSTIYTYLIGKNLALTTTAIAKIFGKRREKVSRLLKDLENKNMIQSASTHIEAATQTGCPEKLYGPKMLNLLPFSTRIFYLLISKLIEKAGLENYQLIYSDLPRRVVVFFDGQINQMFSIDNTWNDLEKEIEDFEENTRQFLAQVDGIASFVPGSVNRFLELLDYYPNVNYVDLVFVKAHKPVAAVAQKPLAGGLCWELG